MKRLHYLLGTVTGAAALTGVALWQLYIHDHPASAPAAAVPAAASEVAAAPEGAAPVAETATLASAVADHRVTAEFVGNGRDRLQIKLANQTDRTFLLTLAAGETFTNGPATVVLLRDANIELSDKPVSKSLITAAVSSSAGVGESNYAPGNRTYPRLRPLLTYLREHPEVTTGTAQTAVLALTENLPVCAFSKFATVGGDMGEVFETTPFRVEVTDIIGALTVLRAAGVSDGELALTIDPQLKIEAMIDSLAHAAAMRYYGITGSQEWDYWKRELTSGDVRTRHYALFGIARYYPDVALQMLPDWVRQPRTNMVFRQSALTALAETQRPAAVSVLSQLVVELGPDTELGQTAQECLTALKSRLQASATKTVAVAFRNSSSLARF